MTCQWSWKHIAKLPDLVAMVWPVVWLLLPVFEGVPVLEFSQFAPFCGRARAPAGSARPLKQRQLDRFRVFFNMHRFGIGNVSLQKWKSTSWAQAVLLLVQSCFWAVERRLSPPGEWNCGSFLLCNLLQHKPTSRSFCCWNKPYGKRTEWSTHHSAVERKNRVKEVLMQMGL